MTASDISRAAADKHHQQAGEYQEQRRAEREQEIRADERAKVLREVREIIKDEQAEWDGNDFEIAALDKLDHRLGQLAAAPAQDAKPLHGAGRAMAGVDRGGAGEVEQLRSGRWRRMAHVGPTPRQGPGAAMTTPADLKYIELKIDRVRDELKADIWRVEDFIRKLPVAPLDEQEIRADERAKIADALEREEWIQVCGTPINAAQFIARLRAAAPAQDGTEE